MRTAAARAVDPNGPGHDLLVRIAALYDESLDLADLARDIHQRIVQLQPRAIPSLRVLIAYRRERELHRELRDALQQLLSAQADAPQEERIAIQLEIAALSQEKLGDAETALSTYAQILELDAQNAAALEGIRAPTAGNIPPALELRRLRIELSRATGDARGPCCWPALGCSGSARRSRGRTQDAARALGRNGEPAGRATSRCRKPCEPAEPGASWSSSWRVGRPIPRPPKVASRSSRRPSCSLKSTRTRWGQAQRERLYRALLLLQPEDNELRWRLLRLLRDGGRYQELADELAGLAALTRHASSDAQSLRFFENELTRLLDLRLNRTPNAEARLTTRSERAPQDPEPILWLASIKGRKGDRAAYMTLRERHAKLLPPTFGRAGALSPGRAVRRQRRPGRASPGYYRTARTLISTASPPPRA